MILDIDVIGHKRAVAGRVGKERKGKERKGERL